MKTLALRETHILDKRPRVITNDTLFAFRYDKEREAANGARLAQLRAAFGEFDATPITEQLRRNEPATLGRGNYTQGIETRYQGLGQGESTAEASEWEPWREGTRTHARLLGTLLHEPSDRGADGREMRFRSIATASDAQIMLRMRAVPQGRAPS